MPTHLKRTSYVLIIMLWVLLTAILPTANAQEDENSRTGFRPDAPPYAIRGPYPVGTRDFVLDEGSERPLIGTIWYPALNPDGVEESVTYDLGLGELAPPMNVWNGRAIRDAAPDPTNGPYPLVVYSPGWGGTRFYGSFIHDHLASQGFIVISVDHTGNTLAENMAQPDVVTTNRYASMIYRPQDVSRQIDYAETLNTGEMSGMIDLEHIGVFGVSFGGYTALMAGGTQLDMTYFRTWCADKADDPACLSLLNHQTEMAALAGLETVPEGLWPSLSDPRVDAIVPIVPGMSEAIGQEGVKHIKVPVMLIGSGADQMASPEENMMLYENMAGKKTHVWFENANHLLIGGLCPEAWQPIFEYCSDPVWDLDRAHDLYNHFITAFFLAELKGDADAAAALAPDVVQFTGITYDTTEF